MINPLPIKFKADLSKCSGYPRMSWPVVIPPGIVKLVKYRLYKMRDGFFYYRVSYKPKGVLFSGKEIVTV